MKNIKRQNAKLIFSLVFGLFLFACTIVPASAQDNWKVGDEVMVEYGRGNFCNGVIETVYKNSSGNKFSVKAKCDNSAFAESVYADASMIRPRPGAGKSVESRRNTNSDEDEKRSPAVKREKDEGGDDSLSYFFGRWDVTSSVGRNTSKVERSDGDYSVTSTVTGKQPPLTINSDGTYKWASNTSGTKIITGRWRRATEKETWGPPGIMLLNARDGVNWVVTEYIAPCTPKYKDNPKWCSEIKEQISIESSVSLSGTRVK